ncbi:selenide, water dikinase [Thermosulfidibacter takaii ABI70S6]|uniref:Selenide, water dikinase n=1 Tax=Thermosulfidibacter takaii (strain DSM 17441 / JCM 13301 / NBRC 103674 / ABI70S6) TaxID=1298851 RepID=A0A0S3QSM0_THET7|nr:selenide, water dikinase [Thermosulfidibacter takaii ABI70S6]
MDLARVLEGLSFPVGQEVIAGVEGFEDAAVVKVSEELALVATLDFITPVVDDPVIFGEIAAANALSDVYAMGADPWFAMNIVCFPCKLPLKFLRAIIEGGLNKIKEAGAYLIGGHTVDDVEPKYGLCVVGKVHPEKVLRNDALRENCALCLTKPIGTGIVVTAIKADMASSEAVRKAVDIMRTLNKEASIKMKEVGAVAATDVTGFGLLGHAMEMVDGTAFDIVIEVESVPVLEEAMEYASFGLIPAGAYENMKYCEGKVFFERELGDLKMILFDPQTSGGLLVAVPEDRVEEFGYFKIGRVVKGEGRVLVV